MAALAGYLLASPTGQPITRDVLLVEPVSKHAPHLINPAQFSGLSRWTSFDFISDRSFEDQPTRKLFHRYNVVLGISGSKLIVLSEKKKLSEYLVESVIDKVIFPRLRPVSIHVDKLVLTFRNKEAQYRITSLQGRYSGPDLNVRTMILYGNEVTDSSVFRQSEHLFNFTRCGIADRYSKDGLIDSDDGEIVSLANDGSIVMQVFSRQRAQDLSKIIAYIIKMQWVDEWVPRSE